MNGQEVVTIARIDIALRTTSFYKQSQDLLRDADIALYRAKARGGGQHEVLDTAMHTGILTGGSRKMSKNATNSPPDLPNLGKRYRWDRKDALHK